MLNCRELGSRIQSRILFLVFRHSSSGCRDVKPCLSPCSGFFFSLPAVFTCPLTWMLSYSRSPDFLAMKLLLKEESNNGEFLVLLVSWWWRLDHAEQGVAQTQESRPPSVTLSLSLPFPLFVSTSFPMPCNPLEENRLCVSAAGAAGYLWKQQC